MKVMLDLNVLLDVVQRREPFYDASAHVLSRMIDREVAGCIPGHALTTVHYIVRRSTGKEQADTLIDLLLAHLDIVPQERSQFLRARNLGFSDFEDAVLASAAEAGGCEYIVTRNLSDFEASPIPAVTPEEFLVLADERSL